MGEGHHADGQATARKVLLVDEDANDLLRYSTILRNEGCEVRASSSYADGAKRAASEDFDLVIVSQGTAAFEGRTVVARALRKRRETPVLVLARSSDIGCYLEAMQMGAFDYREKPLAASGLAEIALRRSRSAAGHQAA